MGGSALGGSAGGGAGAGITAALLSGAAGNSSYQQYMAEMVSIEKNILSEKKGPRIQFR
jgi:hypothetical protein